MDNLIDITQLKKYLIKYSDGETGGMIETDMPEYQLRGLLNKYKFKYKKEFVALIKSSGYYCF